ncbi:MAG: beta-N-acetylhexosaminidase [Acidobacteriota bacterium]|nr:MAG: beta-N-acetylhexosaminidase [Acidobacteriota bacterium]
MKMTWFFSLAVCVTLISCQTGQNPDLGQDALELSLIPYPESVQPLEGTLKVTAETTILADPDASELAESLSRYFNEEFGLNLAIEQGTDSREDGIVLDLEAPGPGSSPEEYQLEVVPEGVILKATAVSGLFYGVQTLKQILSHQSSGSSGASPGLEIPCVSIRDKPRFEWRGLLLDCARTFQSLDYLRKTIDHMSYYKMNVLQLHLTDDQGWRLEIERFPELTSDGSQFAERFKEPAQNQGFYTKQEMRDLVEYASRRGVTIVPEIEMPGHSIAALSCYPDLSCMGGPFEVFPFFLGPNITEDLLCAGNDRTFDFLKGVLEEVLEVFPSEYIHVGGDETPKTIWKKCPKCQSRIKAQGLKDEEELQGWFIEEIGDWLRARGRKLIGWDEILEGNVGQEAAVMSWRGIEGGIEGATAGHRVVMSPVTHCYLDFSPVQIPIREMYLYEPVPESLTAGQAELIMGLQANFWSAIDRTPARVDAMLYPRVLAIAERGWSAGESRDWEDFESRLGPHRHYLQQKGTILWEEPVAEWSGRELASGIQEISIDVSERIKAPGRYSVYFRKKAWEDAKIKVHESALFEGDRLISSDDHLGVAGWDFDQPDYFLEVSEVQEGANYQLRIRLEGTGREGGGEVYFGPSR